jgi:rRNA maturation endonuclease Nob1
MTAADRQRIRQAIDQHKRAERAAIIAIANGQGRCKACATRYEDGPNEDCQTCRERVRIRRKEPVPNADEVAAEMYGAAWGT